MRILALLLLAFVSTVHAETLVVVNKADNNVSLIDLETGLTRAILAAGEGPHEVATSPDGQRALVTNYGRSQPGNSLTLLDVASAQVLTTFPLGNIGWPHGIAWSDNNAWVTVEENGVEPGNGALLRVDPVDGTVRSAVSTGQPVSHMVALHPTGSLAYVANIVGDSISVFDLSLEQRLAIVSAGRGPEGIAVSPDGTELWVANQDSSDITVFAADTLSELARIQAHGRPIRIAFTPDGARTLVTCARTNELAVFDARQRREITRVRFAHDANPGWPFGLVPSPVGVLVPPDGERAFVALVATDIVVEVDLNDYRIKRLLPTGNQPDGMAWTPVTVSTP
jgi:YVTN family beta-propeller protein